MYLISVSYDYIGR